MLATPQLAQTLQQIPTGQKMHKPLVALVGRPNVGKSTPPKRQYAQALAKTFA
jgi:GTP-binding protein EngB required for normal cell division